MTKNITAVRVLNVLDVYQDNPLGNRYVYQYKIGSAGTWNDAEIAYCKQEINTDNRVEMTQKEFNTIVTEGMKQQNEVIEDNLDDE